MEMTLMRFRRIVRNKKVIAIVLATITAFVAVLTSCNHNQKYSNNKHKTNITYQNKQQQQKHVKLQRGDTLISIPSFLFGCA
jgi:cell division protein FtsL